MTYREDANLSNHSKLEGSHMIQDYMTDIESMGTNANDAIISIGLVPMDIEKREISKGFYIKISLKSCQKAGFNINAETVMWWLQQDQAARDEFKGNYAHADIKDALKAMSAFIRDTAQVDDISDIKIWGNGAAMDNVLLAAAFDRCEVTRPWTHLGDRCYRTLKNLTPSVERVEPTIAHHALYDAEAQALTLFKRLDKLGL